MDNTTQGRMASTRGARTRLRLTRRGRRVLAGLVLVVSAAAGVAGWSATANASTQAGSRPSYVQVRSGETLWQIAQEAAPDQDPRDVVTALMTANHLDSATLQPGARLLVPDNL